MRAGDNAPPPPLPPPSPPSPSPAPPPRGDSDPLFVTAKTSSLRPPPPSSLLPRPAIKGFASALTFLQTRPAHDRVASRDGHRVQRPFPADEKSNRDKYSLARRRRYNRPSQCVYRMCDIQSSRNSDCRQTQRHWISVFLDLKLNRHVNYTAYYF